ncbi:hypothetical protein GCM10010211_82560 [Streptomyces albospinus]|uniref:Uncharacterized protein n=1 Tax=Streptomyces albospinus TaxID=285515 RepID=A0ABQ2VS67_9ACTN|nr:hypothetical protein GCM10010211_82560 [Streptomyces albospinus]
MVVESDPVPSAVVAIVACSLLGAVYAPMAPGLPARRRQVTLGILDPDVHVVASGLPVTPGVPVYARMADGRFMVEGEARDRLGRRERARQLSGIAHVVFTSGTTGRPKGIMMSHSAVVAFFHGMARQVRVSADERLLSVAPLSFDFSLLDLGLAASAGATLVQVPRTLLRHPRRFVAYLARERVTQVNGVPSVWQPILAHAAAELSRCTALRTVLMGGEFYPVSLIRELRQARPGLRVVNAFGQSESIACSFLQVPDPVPEDLGQVPIGPPHPGAEYLLVDAQGRDVGVGESGELFLRSNALFAGYWRDAEATRRALVPPPGEPDSPERVLRTGDVLRREGNGTFSFVGRADLQVKILGNRVELEEVELALRAHPDVEDTVVTAVPSSRGTRLAALVASATRCSEQADLAGEVRALCASTLPSYMVPTHVLLAPALPRTAAGKLDRAAAHAMVVRLLSPVPDEGGTGHA